MGTNDFLRQRGKGHSAEVALAEARALAGTGRAVSVMMIRLPVFNIIKTFVRDADDTVVLYCELSPEDTRKVLDAIGPHVDVTPDVDRFRADGLDILDAITATRLTR